MDSKENVTKLQEANKDVLEAISLVRELVEMGQTRAPTEAPTKAPTEAPSGEPKPKREANAEDKKDEEKQDRTAPKQKSKDLLPCAEHYTSTTIQNINDHDCTAHGQPGPCATLSVQRWSCSCTACIKNGTLDWTCNVPDICSRTVTDAQTERISVFKNTLQYYEFHVAERTALDNKNRANTVT